MQLTTTIHRCPTTTSTQHKPHALHNTTTTHLQPQHSHNHFNKHFAAINLHVTTCEHMPPCAVSDLHIVINRLTPNH